MKTSTIYLAAICLPFTLAQSTFSEAAARTGNNQNILVPPGDFLGFSIPTVGSKWPFPKGSVWIHASTSLGSMSYPKFGTRSAFLPLIGAAEYSLDPYWAAGPYVGYYSVSYSDSYLGESYSAKLRSFVFGARLTFHGTALLRKYCGTDLDVKKWDIYSTASFGMVSNNWNVNERFENTQNYESMIYPSLGIMVGAKYFAYSTLAIHGELGKGPFGLINFGISFWLK
jgi:hypothetical protein